MDKVPENNDKLTKEDLFGVIINSGTTCGLIL
jgi:hypothetical protein